MVGRANASNGKAKKSNKTTKRTAAAATTGKKNDEILKVCDTCQGIHLQLEAEEGCTLTPASTSNASSSSGTQTSSQGSSQTTTSTSTSKSTAIKSTQVIILLGLTCNEQTSLILLTVTSLGPCLLV